MASLEQLVAARVRQARKRADFTLEQLAQKIGVETTTLSRYERGRGPSAWRCWSALRKRSGCRSAAWSMTGKPVGTAVTDEDDAADGLSDVVSSDNGESHGGSCGICVR